MSDETELDLEKEKRELAYCETCTYSGKIYAYWRVKKLIKEVERLRGLVESDMKCADQDEEIIGDLEKENAALKEEVEEWKIANLKIEVNLSRAEGELSGMKKGLEDFKDD